VKYAIRQQPLLSNGSANKHVSTATIAVTEERCFLRGPCRNVKQGKLAVVVCQLVS
jgi:hypothetical protein